MTSYAEGLIFDLYRINCYTMPYRNENTTFKYINGKDYDQYDKLIRIADYTSGALADFNFETQKFSMEKHELIFRALIESNKSFIFKIDHIDNLLSVGRVCYINE